LWDKHKSNKDYFLQMLKKKTFFNYIVVFDYDGTSRYKNLPVLKIFDSYFNEITAENVSGFYSIIKEYEKIPIYISRQRIFKLKRVLNKD